MPPMKCKSIIALEDNNTEIYMVCTEVLVRIAGNILKEPENPKYRSISLGSNVVTNKLLPASGAMQCLFEMGFQEGSDKLILPPGTSLDCLKYIYDELLKRRELRRRKKPENISQDRLTSNPVLTLIQKEITVLIKSMNNIFFDKFIDNILDVWRCESVHLQIKALKCVPLPDLKKNAERVIRQTEMAIKRKEIENQIIDFQEFLLLELCKWFKSRFFQWVNTPECTKCGNKNTEFKERNKSTTNGLSSVEVYTCVACAETVLFPRYRDAEKLLETRRGRCGEWAHCFYLICRSLGWDVRFVVDETDHVWVEIYSYIKKKWIHCDPCETVIDAPLIYECGWKKNLSYVIAYSKDEIQDVTWRYSCDYSRVLENRRKCSEEELVDLICNVRRTLLSFASERRRQFVTERAAMELVDLLVQKTATESEKQGRLSGSLAWRLARGEITPSQEFRPFVWTPDANDKENMKFTLSYCTSTDEYSAGSAKTTVKGWRNGLYGLNSVFRKEEGDWKMVYLAREEGRDRGTLAWRFQVDEDYAIGDVQVKLVAQIYESGKVACKLCNDKICINIPDGEPSFLTSDLKGSKQVELGVELSGGNGENAWQHAQLLRQSLGECDTTLQIIIYLIRT